MAGCQPGSRWAVASAGLRWQRRADERGGGEPQRSAGAAGGAAGRRTAPSNRVGSPLQSATQQVAGGLGAPRRRQGTVPERRGQPWEPGLAEAGRAPPRPRFKAATPASDDLTAAHQRPRRKHRPDGRTGGRVGRQGPGRTSGNAVWHAGARANGVGPNHKPLAAPGQDLAGTCNSKPQRRARPTRLARFCAAGPIGAHSCTDGPLPCAQLGWRNPAEGARLPPRPGRMATSRPGGARLPTGPLGSPLPPARAHSARTEARARAPRRASCPPPWQASGVRPRRPASSALGSNRFRPRHDCRTTPPWPAGPRLGGGTQIALPGASPCGRTGLCRGPTASRATEARRTCLGSTSWLGTARWKESSRNRAPPKQERQRPAQAAPRRPAQGRRMLETALQPFSSCEDQ